MSLDLTGLDTNAIALISGLGGAVIGAGITAIGNYHIGKDHNSKLVRNTLELETLELMIKYRLELDKTLSNLSALPIANYSFYRKADYEATRERKSLSRISLLTDKPSENFLTFMNNEYTALIQYLNLFDVRYSVLYNFQNHKNIIHTKKDEFEDVYKLLIDGYGDTFEYKLFSGTITDSDNYKLLKDYENQLTEIMCEILCYVDDVNTHFSNDVMKNYYPNDRRKPLRAPESVDAIVLARKIKAIK